MMRCIKSLRISGALLLLMSFCAGCAPARKIESVKVAGYSKVPQSILAFLPTGSTTMTSNGVVLPSNTEAPMGDGFDEVFLKFAAVCNITAHTNIEEKINGKMQTLDALIAAHNPEWIMGVEATTAETRQMTYYGVPQGLPAVTALTYNVTLFDRTENKKVWRANLTVNMGKSWLTDNDYKQPGRNLATAVIQRMRTDGLLTSCPALPD